MTSSTRYIYSKLDINMAAFRYWQDKPREILEMLYYDTAMGYYISEGFTREAMQPGFKFVDDKGNECEKCKTLDKKRMKHLKEIYIKGRSASKWFGYSVLIRLKREGETTDPEIGNDNPGYFYWLEDTHVTEMDIKKGSKELTKLWFRDPEEMPVLAATAEGLIKVDDDALKDVRLLGNYQKEMGKFRSTYEPIIDNLLSYSTFMEELTIGIVRTYGGLRILIAPARYFKDPVAKKELMETMNNTGHNFLLGGPDNKDEGEFKFDINFGSGAPPFSPAEASKELIKPIAIFVKIPVTALSGEELGLRAGETNRQSFLNSMSEEQKDMDDDLVWMTSVEFNDDHIMEHGLEWNPLVEVDETEYLTNIKTKFEIFTANMHIVKDPVKLLAFLDLDIEIDKEKMEADRLQKEALKQRLMEGTTDDGNTKPSPEGAKPTDTPQDPSKDDDQED